MRVLNDLLVSLSLLTRLPLKLDDTLYDRSAQAAWAYPLVGGVTGLTSACAALFALWLGLPSTAAGLIAIATGIMVTGAMHEDGLADCADGFWGGWDQLIRLKIMKDSQIGTYGVLALLVTVGLRVICLTALIESLAPSAFVYVVVAVHIASRAVMPVIMASLPNVRSGGLSSQVGDVSGQSATLAAAIGIGVLCLGLGFGSGTVALGAIALSFFIWRAVAHAKIGGQTGDVIGAGQQIAEVTAYLALTGLL